MGLLAVIDTFLIYKISEIRYNRRVALIASILFAVMPLTWLTRLILLDSIMLPFILSSILFAVYYNKKMKIENASRKMLGDKKEIKLSNPSTILILISGIFLGLAIFTKVPAFCMIPLVGYLIFSTVNGNNTKRIKNLKAVGLWLIPVILIPTIWPIYSIYVGEVNIWLDSEQGVFWQTQRASQPLSEAINSLLEIDPVLVVLGTVALIYTTFVKRDVYFLLWILPFTVFYYFIGYVSYFHMIPLFPLFCIAISRGIVDICERITEIYKPQRPITDYFFQRNDSVEEKIQSYGEFYILYNDLKKKFRFLGSFIGRIEILIVLPLGLFGLMSLLVLIQIDVNSNYFVTIASLLQHIADRNYNSDNLAGNYNYDITVVGSPRYFWILEHIFDKDYFYKSYNSKTPIQTQRNMFIVDDGAKGSLSRNAVINDLYNTTRPIETIETHVSEYDFNNYPFGSMKYNRQDSRIEIRSSD